MGTGKCHACGTNLYQSFYKAEKGGYECPRCHVVRSDLDPPGPNPSANRRPIWALPVLITGLLVTVWLVLVLADWVAGVRANPASEVVPTMVLGYWLPFALLLSAVMLLAGGLGVIWPRLAKRPWLGLVVVGAVSAWVLAAIVVPGLLTR